MKWGKYFIKQLDVTNMVAICLTAPVGGWALIGLLSSFAGVSDCVVDAVMY